MNHKLNAKIAIGAIAAALAAPAFAQDSTPWWQPHWLTRWIPAHTNTIDTINGNDFRDNRDSTISRNDVPLNQTTLVNEPREQYHGNTQRDPGSADSWHSSAAPVGGTALPATAVAENRTPPAANQMSRTEVDEIAQRNEMIVNSAPEPSVAAKSDLGQPAQIDSDDVTARNTGGVQGVHDGINQDVYTGVEGAGGTSAMSAGRDGEEIMTQ